MGADSSVPNPTVPRMMAYSPKVQSTRGKYGGIWRLGKRDNDTAQPSNLLLMSRCIVDMGKGITTGRVAFRVQGKDSS